MAGGAGSAVGETAPAAPALRCRLLQIGIPDRFIEHGSREECLVMAGLDAAAIRTRVAGFWKAQGGTAQKLASQA